MSLYDIKTEAGKTLWEKVNQEYGSAVWGAVGQGIEAIEAEVEQRIIKLLEDLDSALFDDYKKNHTGPYGEGLSDGVTKAVALIKGEQK